MSSLIECDVYVHIIICIYDYGILPATNKLNNMEKHNPCYTTLFTILMSVAGKYLFDAVTLQMTNMHNSYGI